MSVSGRIPFATLTNAFERCNISQSTLPWVRRWTTNPANAEYTVKVWNPVGTNQTGAWSVRVISPSKEGSTVVWENNADHQAEHPLDLTNTLAVCAGRAHAASLQEDGRVRVWGDNQFGQTNVPSNLSNVVAIAAGDDHSLALKADGSVVAWGRNNFNQTNIPTSLTNAIAVSAGGAQGLALRKDSTVIQWGQTNAAIPNGLTNVSAIASGTNFYLALRSNTTVVAWGLNNFGQTNVPSGLTNVVAIAAGGFHALALKENGTVVAWGANGYGQTNVPAGLSNVMAVAAGWTCSVALNNDGTVVVWGDNTYGQTNAVLSLGTVKSIAAGGHTVMAANFSPLVQYPVDVRKDLLLIFNTTSTNSIVVKDYYLVQRPMVSGANTLGFSCATNEVISTADFTNQILASYRTWLTNNPTKRPQYLILFPDLPTRIWGDTNNPFTYSNSVAFELHSGAPGIPPFVTSINMGFDNLTNDCIAYINKLRDFGTNYSAGKLFISAGTYGNTNYIVDNVRHGSGYSPSFAVWGTYVFSSTNGLFEAGVSPLEINYLTGIETRETNVMGGWIYHDLPHITNAVNVAGYISWGSHSSLGNEYPRVGPIRVKWTGNSSWWIIETIESYNGIRHPGQGNFTQWFSQDAFGGTNYSNTPVGAVTHTDEPGLDGVNDSHLLFGLWAQGKSFAISGWNSRVTPRFQAVGDPFTTK